MDLRILNMDISFAVTLTRNLNGVNFTLPPNDKKYVYPIPENEVRLTGLVKILGRRSLNYYSTHYY